MPRPRLLICILSIAAGPLLAQAPNAPNAPNAAEAEVQKCEDKIGSVQRDVLGKYDDTLGELQLTFQKAADLEGALAVRTERERMKKEHTLSDGDLVSEPKALRALQSQYLAKELELVGQLIRETVPRLLEYKKALTVAGKLDDALAVRTAIENLQNNHLPVVKPEAGAIIPTETLLLAYSGDRARADKIYKGQKIIVHGIVGGYRQDPADPKYYLIFLAGGQSGGWVQCSFNSPEYRFREEAGAFGSTTLMATPKGSENAIRIQKGQVIDIRGNCQGFDEIVKLSKCDLPK